ncbi:hypothetical protein V6C42_00050 [Pseudoclostridium thermosuccinogenes]|nr:hypothetical protein [Pseudoclostridium thermosuccinogenes]
MSQNKLNNEMVSVLLNLRGEHEEICAENELLAILAVTAGSGNDMQL